MRWEKQGEHGIRIIPEKGEKWINVAIAIAIASFKLALSIDINDPKYNPSDNLSIENAKKFLYKPDKTNNLVLYMNVVRSRQCKTKLFLNPDKTLEFNTWFLKETNRNANTILIKAKEILPQVNEEFQSPVKQLIKKIQRWLSKIRN